MKMLSLAVVCGVTAYLAEVNISKAQGLLDDFMFDGPQRTEVALCEKDDLSCDAPFIGAKRGIERVDPVCEIDPCACDECAKPLQHSTFESLQDVQSILPHGSGNATKLLGSLPIKKLESPSFDGLFVRDEQPLSQNASTSFSADRNAISESMAHDRRDAVACNIAHERPGEYWRELIIRHDNLVECSKAAELALERRAESGQDWLSVLAQQPGFADRQITLKVFEDYRKACVHPLSDIKSTYPVSAMFGPSFPDEAKGQIGELNYEGRGIHCTAAIGKRGNGTRGLVTAAHCIGSPTLGAGDGKLQFGEVHTDMKFMSFAGKNYRVKIDPALRGFVYDRMSDAVFIPLVSDDTTIPDGFPIGPAPSVWDPLYIVAVNPFLGALTQALRRDNSSLLDAGSISLEAGCRVYGINGQSLLHNCQTEKSMSGSPVFVSSGGKAMLIGVVSGEAEQPTIDKCPKPTAAAANLITIVTP
ncbi:trypsin-like serine peptidase [Rhizobium laguerreae]|uniref:trypsin-like serine peptidase n=1 Tax=Rhizobium laguerreae TaxID=1076926 RepID=UPI0010389D01|nr:hypothetical protein [Rhizobium laguerreae]TBY07323.1 hypothetical protein E0I94_20940 [Rhizobium laguerreae]